MKGKSKITLTGQLGDVMKESAQAALAYTRANAKALGISDKWFDDYEIHVHLPAGAIAKGWSFCWYHHCYSHYIFDHRNQYKKVILP